MALDNPAPEGRMTRREAMLQLLRLTGAGAGTAAAAFWLAERSALPTSTEAANVRRDHTVESNAALPEMVVGDNVFTYSDQSPEERKVKITHNWVERSASTPPAFSPAFKAASWTAAPVSALACICDRSTTMDELSPGTIAGATT